MSNEQSESKSSYYYVAPTQPELNDYNGKMVNSYILLQNSLQNLGRNTY